MNSQSTYDSFKKSPIRSIKYSSYFQVYDSLFSRYIISLLFFMPLKKSLSSGSSFAFI